MSLGIRSWVFYGLGFGKKIRSVDAWQFFGKQNFKIVLDFSHQSFGGLPASELSFIITAAKFLNCKNIFEFGTCTGVTAYNLALNTEASICTLDLPKNTAPAMALEHAEEEYVQGQFQYLHWEGKSKSEKITAIKGDSADFDTTPFAKKMDLVFVDASHSYEYVLNDTKKAFEMLTPRGMILWHDYMPAWPGVIKGLNQISKTKQLFHIRGTSLVMHLAPELLREKMQNV